jgi:hypothetical protein
MIDKILLQRYADVGSRRIVGSECKLEAVLLTATEKEWALNGQSVERQQSGECKRDRADESRVLAGNNS